MTVATAGHAQIASERVAGLLVDFVAVRPDGTPVEDLQATEIELKINGRPRRVKSLRRVTTAAASAAAAISPAPAPFGTNDAVVAGRSFAIILDEESFVAGHVPLLKNAVEGLLADFVPHDQALVAALPFSGVRIPFTADKVKIRMAVAALTPRGTQSETGSDLACRTRRFLESLDAFLQKHSGRAAPLTVVLITAGVAAPRRDAAMAEAPGMCELLVSHFQRVSIAAGAARANFFVVHPDDVGAAGQRWRESIGGVGYLGSDNPLEGIENLAGVTRAVRLPLTATGTSALERVTREAATYYMAEIDREREDVAGRSRQLDIRVLRREITVRARPEITFVEPRPGARATRLALSDLLASRDAFTDVRLRAAGFTVRESDGRLRVGVVVEPEDDGAQLASVGAVLIQHGQPVSRWTAGDTLARPLLGAIAAPAAGTYRLRVVAIDNAGRIGAAEDVLEVGLTTVGSLSLGSLLLGISRHDTLVPQLQFSKEPTAIASFDIYGGDAGTRVSAAVELLRADGSAIVTLPLALARADQGRVVAKGAVPVGALPPGDYIVRGVIKLEDGTTGRVVRTLRKVI